MRKEARQDVHHWTLDELDPPAWGPPPADATGLMKSVYALRPREVETFSAEDLRLAIGQEIAVSHLVPLALRRLEEDPMLEGDFYPGDLLKNVLGVGADFWAENPELKLELDEILNRIDPEDEDVDEVVTQAIERFRAL